MKPIKPGYYLRAETAVAKTYGGELIPQSAEYNGPFKSEDAARGYAHKNYDIESMEETEEGWESDYTGVGDPKNPKKTIYHVYTVNIEWQEKPDEEESEDE